MLGLMAKEGIIKPGKLSTKPVTQMRFSKDPPVLMARCFGCKKPVSLCRGECFDGLTRDYIDGLDRDYRARQEV